MPHIATPSGTEFLLTTGTSVEDPGVGMFVNLDGDVVRGTIQFSTYPESMVLEGGDTDAADTPSPDGGQSEGYVLAIVRPMKDHKRTRMLQVQRWDVDSSLSLIHI